MKCISNRTTYLVANSSYLYADVHSALFNKKQGLASMRALPLTRHLC